MIICVQIANKTLPYDSLNELRQRMTEVSPNLTRYGVIEPANFFSQSVSMAQVRSFVRAHYFQDFLTKSYFIIFLKKIKVLVI